MNNDFESWYLALLRKQVEEEIQFLVTNGHDNTFVPVKCMFCVETASGKHHCRRLNELRQFQSSIMSNIRSSADRRGRRQIGRETIISTALEMLQNDSTLSNPFQDNQPLIVIK